MYKEVYKMILFNNMQSDMLGSRCEIFCHLPTALVFLVDFLFCIVAVDLCNFMRIIKFLVCY